MLNYEFGNVESLIKLFNAKAVMKSSEKGTRIEYTELDESESLHALVLSLDNEFLSIRRVVKDDAVNRLLENIN